MIGLRILNLELHFFLSFFVGSSAKQQEAVLVRVSVSETRVAPGGERNLYMTSNCKRSRRSMGAGVDVWVLRGNG